MNEEAMRSPLSVLREGAIQALREASGEMTNAGWSVAVENHTLALVGVSEVPMGRNMLFLDMQVQNWGEKDLCCEIKGYYPNLADEADEVTMSRLPEPREFVGGEGGVTVRQSEGGIPTPRRAARLLLLKEEHDPGSPVR